MEQNKKDVIVHYVANSSSGKNEDYFPNGICNTHTHGMWQYHIPEFQMVLDFGPRVNGAILNEVYEMVENGDKFSDGDFINGLFADNKDRRVMLKIIKSNGKDVMRLIVEDKQGRFPDEEGCEYPFNRQYGNVD